MLELFDNKESRRIIYIRIKTNELVINLIIKEYISEKKLSLEKIKGVKIIGNIRGRKYDCSNYERNHICCKNKDKNFFF